MKILAYDAALLHYTIPLCTRLETNLIRAFEDFDGLKIAMPQDEYMHTDMVRDRLEFSGFNLIFTCIPPQYQRNVYGDLVDKVRLPPPLLGPLSENHDS